MIVIRVTEAGNVVIYDHSQKWFQAFNDPKNNILSGDYAATGGTGRLTFWIDKETGRAYIPKVISSK